MQPDRALIAVSDTGIGIPADEIDRLFSRFFRASTATQNAIPGVGLGLTITQAIAVAHHGRIRVASTVGEGTTFTFELPLLEEVDPRGRIRWSADQAEVARSASRIRVWPIRPRSMSRQRTPDRGQRTAEGRSPI